MMLEGILLWLFVLLYLVPFLRLVTFPFEYGARWFMRINGLFGRWEQSVAWYRDSIGVLFLFYVLLGSRYKEAFGGELLYLSSGGAAGGFVFLTIMSRLWKEKAEDRLIEFIRISPPMYPQEAFDHYFCSMGAVRHSFRNAPYCLIDPTSLDCRSDGRCFFRFALIRGVWSTIWIMRFSLKALRRRGEEYLRSLTAPFSILWGARLVQVARAQFIVDGKERLARRRRYNLYVSNHTSLYDFVVLPLAVGELPRFLLARDHFIDNPILYHVLKIGRVIEALHMVLVNRKSLKFAPDTPEEERASQRRKRARAVVSVAIERMIDEELPIALYPQGTRARLTTTESGERMGAGYYTAGKLDRLVKEGGHLKKGAAYLAIDAAMNLAKRGIDEPITILPLCITGAAVVCPRKSLRLQLGVTMKMRIEEPIQITPQMIRGFVAPKEGSAPAGSYKEAVENLHQRIDRLMASGLRIHSELETRFLKLVREKKDPQFLDEVTLAIQEWRGTDTILFAILDYIFASPPDRWRPLIGQVTHLLTHQARRAEFVTLRNILAQEL